MAVNNPKITLSYYSAVKINGTAYTPTGSGELTIPFVGTLNTLLLENTDGSGNVVRAYGLKPDGTNLVTITDSASTDALRDSPVNGDSANDTGAGNEITGNYATWNPLTTSSNLTDGNLVATNTASGYQNATSSIAVKQGKWYVEIQLTLSGTYPGFGIADIASAAASSPGYTSYIGVEAKTYGYFPNSGWYSPETTPTYNSASISTGDIIGLALDLDSATKTLKTYINGTFDNTVNIVDSDKGYVFGIIGFDAASSAIANFGQRPFAYTAPSGYKCLNTANLPDPTIADGSTAFDTSLWAGNNSTQTITGLNFKPDLVWIKQRSSTFDHNLVDAVQGTTKTLIPNKTDPAATGSGNVTSFNSDGFGVSSSWTVNKASNTYVGWAWDAGSSTTTIAAGGLNSSLYNQSQNWSGSGSPASGWAKAFDGQIGSYSYGVYSTGGSSLTFTFDVNNKPTWSNKIEVFFRKYDGTANVNGGSDFTTVSPWTTPGTYVEGWYDISSIAGTSGTLSSIYTSDVGSNYVSIQAIRLDGKILVDSTVSLVVPSIASTVRANPSAGFSIVKWNNGTISSTASVGHGLNAAPAFYIIKDIDSADSWYTYHKGMGNTKYLTLDNATQATTSSVMWGSTSPDTSTFPVGTTFSGTGDYIAYCFAPVEGYSAMGSYVGNAAADPGGPFVFLGFKPAFLMVKSLASSWWTIYDNARDTDNPVYGSLYPNETDAEYSGTPARVDFLSNGFKVRSGTSDPNASATWIYYAVAENPFKTSRAR